MKQELRIIFMGTPEFAVPSLSLLVESGYTVAAVVTAPDKPSGRGLQVTKSPVKEYALLKNIPVLQPDKLKDEHFLIQLASFKANLFVVVAFRMLPEAVWKMPALGTFNLHGSLLPQYRGAAPIHWAVINGEKKTGVTTFFLQHEIDTGDIIDSEEEEIVDNDTTGTLYDRLKDKGAALVLKTVRAIENQTVQSKPQPILHTLREAPKIKKDHCLINWHTTSDHVRNFVRGLSPFPTAFTRVEGKLCKIYSVMKTGVSCKDNAPGTIKTDGSTYLHVATSDEWVAIDELQIEGKKRMHIQEFLRGNKLTTSQI